MGRVYDNIISNNKSLYTLFDTGAMHNYITKRAAEGLVIGSIPEPFKIGLGGEAKTIYEACLIAGRLQGNSFYFSANIAENIGKDERGQEIDAILGAIEMQRWNIRIDPEEEKLDLSGFRKEFIEYYGVNKDMQPKRYIVWPTNKEIDLGDPVQRKWYIEEVFLQWKSGRYC